LLQKAEEPQRRPPEIVNLSAILEPVRAGIDEVIQRPFAALMFFVVNSENRFVQYRSDNSELYGECVSNAFLGQFEQLSNSEHNVLLAFGWNSPNKETENYWRNWARPVDANELVELTMKTLIDVFRAREGGIRTDTIE
jgi:hypothetical protein